MERRTVSRFGLAKSLVCILAMAGITSGLEAQTPVPGAPNPPSGQILQPQQLENLVAPIALYPDPLLGQMLVAATYPVELVEAQQWLEVNGNLQGQQRTDAARQQNWDASVQALVAVPNALNMLTQDVRWTTDLGNAFLAQQADVMSAVQRMRARAQANGQLRSTPQETVTTQSQDGQAAIDIQPADPQVVYVPAYDPYYVFGWGAYPPLYYPDGYWFEPGINIGFCFGGWRGWGYGGWGWGVNWFGRGIFVNNGFFNRYGYRYGYGFAGGFAGRTAWQHDPAHRAGVNYPNSQLGNRFGAASQAARVEAGRSGNWHTFGQGTTAGRNSFLGSGRQAEARGFQSGAGSANWQRFSGSQGNASRGQGYQSAAPRNSAPSYRGAQRSFQSAPRASAPSFGGGGGARSFGGGGAGRSFGGGGSRSSGGGGSHSSGGHGGGRR